MITTETRRESYSSILKSLGTRQAQVFTELLCYPDGVTASELSFDMHEMGFFRSHDRNNVHPRLNEMVEKGMVEVIGKKQCRITSKTVAVYKVTDHLYEAIQESIA
jgi:hypothetical protein